MYAKIFAQIYDSSIADDYEVRHFFMDMLVLADLNGHVDMTHEAIAARTRIPLEVVRRHIATLEKPDPRSRTRDREGRRLIPIDSKRGWGWIIVNYLEYRRVASEEQRREMTKTRTRKWRNNKMLENGDASVTHGDACDAMQRQRQKQIEKAPNGFSSLGDSRNGQTTTATNGAQKVILNQELERVNHRIKTIEDNYASHQTMTQDDRAEVFNLKSRRKEIKSDLGIKY